MRFNWIDVVFASGIAAMLGAALALPPRPLPKSDLQACREMNQRMAEQLKLVQPNIYPR